MEKYYWWIYFFVAIAVSLYSQLDALTFIHFLVGSLVTFLFFVGIYFCLRNISSYSIPQRVTRSIYIIMLLGMIYISGAVASASRINSDCYNLVAKDIFTGKIAVDCNPTWHTTIIGGDEARKILLNHCLTQSALLKRHPDYCDVYKNTKADKDWTKGSNP